MKNEHEDEHFKKNKERGLILSYQEESTVFL